MCSKDLLINWKCNLKSHNTAALLKMLKCQICIDAHILTFIVKRIKLINIYFGLKGTCELN